MALGMSESEAQGTGDRGTNQGSQLAGNADLWVGNNLENNQEFGTSGFNGLPAGFRYSNLDISYMSINKYSYFWSSTSSVDDSRMAWKRDLVWSHSEVWRSYIYKHFGFSIRCIKD